jgi:hypothetical protein
MRTGRYSMAELFGSRHIEQFVIPEIQRDYVWEGKQVITFLSSILNNFKAWRKENEHPSFSITPVKESTNLDSSETDELKATFAALCAKRYFSTNIGFIYAYTDGDLPGQYYLIDGQQRLTTIYLTLLVTASLADNDNEKLKDQFRSRYCQISKEPVSDSKSAQTRLDYRLRELTTDFFHHYVPFLLKNPSNVEQLTKQSWYRAKLDKDLTAENLIKNFKTIHELIRDTKIEDIHLFFIYLEDLVDCWYFDTNESSQGEGLYIYLNARGQDTAPNENLKALILSKVTDVNKDMWGKRWEEWQDFFWQCRHKGITEGTNPNADRGFDCFLSCVTNLERLRTGNTTSNFEITMEVIEKYFQCLEWLGEQKETFKQFYNLTDRMNPDKPPYIYAGWIDAWFNKVWSTLNDPEIEDKNKDKDKYWSFNLSDPNKTLEPNRKVLIWGTFLSVFCSLEKCGGVTKDIDIKKVFRTIRIFWLRYNNNNRAVTSLSAAVNEFLFDDQPTFIGTESQEEKAKWMLLKNRSESERCEFESIIWQIEDHPLNIDGAGLGSLNITHLVDLEHKVLTRDRLDSVRKSFYELFPLNVKNTDKRIAQALLYYGVFWQQETPWYYNNYNLGGWRLTVRGRGGEELKSPQVNGTVFRRFFEDFIRSGASLDDFLNQKRGTESIDPEKTTDIRKALLWYSEKLGKTFLSKGYHVALSNNGEKDKYLPVLDAIWNLPRYFQGDYQKMSDQVSQLNK